MEIAAFNAAWLEAWSAKDTARLLDFYHPNVIYRDGQTAAGITGHDALRAYLDGLFAATPPMRYEPHETWAIEGGYCGRWYCTVDLPGGGHTYLRGFDLVEMRDGKIALNEVYTHNLPGPPD